MSIVNAKLGNAEVTAVRDTAFLRVFTAVRCLNGDTCSRKLGGEPNKDQGLKSVRDKFLAAKSADEIKTAFQRFDADSSGTISPDEFARGAKSLGIKLSRQQIEHVFEECDEDGDGELDFDEFVTRVLQQEPLPRDKIQNIKRQVSTARKGRLRSCVSEALPFFS